MYLFFHLSIYKYLLHTYIYLYISLITYIYTYIYIQTFTYIYIGIYLVSYIRIFSGTLFLIDSVVSLCNDFWSFAIPKFFGARHSTGQCAAGSGGIAQWGEGWEKVFVFWWFRCISFVNENYTNLDYFLRMHVLVDCSDSFVLDVEKLKDWRNLSQPKLWFVKFGQLDTPCVPKQRGHLFMSQQPLWHWLKSHWWNNTLSQHERTWFEDSTLSTFLGGLKKTKLGHSFFGMIQFERYSPVHGVTWNCVLPCRK